MKKSTNLFAVLFDKLGLQKNPLRYWRFWLLLLFPLTLLLRACAEHIPSFADLYCDRIYRYVSRFGHRVSGLFPFSVGEWLLYVGMAAIIVFIVAVIVVTVKRKGKRLRTLLSSIVSLACAVSVTLFLFYTNCGLNYYRSDFQTLSGLSTKPTSADTLYDTCVWLAQNAAHSGQNVSRDDKGEMKLSGDTSHLAAQYVNHLHQKYDFIYDGYGSPKGVLASRGMSFCCITGVYFPFTFEANVNTDIPAYSIPETMCHELCHVRGFMHEEDANFLAFLACIHSDNDDFVYSGSMLALAYASNALYSADKDKYYRLVSEYYTDEMMTDIHRHTEYWQQFETPVAETASQLNDIYLRSNAQDNGIKSYGKMTDLVIAYYDSEILP